VVNHLAFFAVRLPAGRWQSIMRFQLLRSNIKYITTYAVCFAFGGAVLYVYVYSVFALCAKTEYKQWKAQCCRMRTALWARAAVKPVNTACQ